MEELSVIKSAHEYTNNQVSTLKQQIEECKSEISKKEMIVNEQKALTRKMAQFALKFAESWGFQPDETMQQD